MASFPSEEELKKWNSKQAKELTNVKLGLMNRFDDKIELVYFVEEMLLMDLTSMIANYGDSSVAILGSVVDFGLPHPTELRREDTRRKKADVSRQKMLNRFLMLANGIDIPSVMIMNHPELHDKWAMTSFQEGKPLEMIKPSKTSQRKAKVLAEMIIEHDVLTHQQGFFTQRRVRKALLQRRGKLLSFPLPKVLKLCSRSFKSSQNF